MKRWMPVLLTLLMLLWAAAFCARAERNAPITSKEQLNQESVTIGVSTGTVSETSVMNELPKAKIAYYDGHFLAYADVAAGKVDAYVYDMRQMKVAIQNGLSGVRLLEETMDQRNQVAVGLSDISPIPDLADKMNRFIAEIKENGVLDEMFTRWVINGSEEMPDIQLPEKPEYHLRVGTTGIVPPYSYYKGQDLAGYDIELARRFAAWLGADLEFSVFDYGAVAASLKGGRVDVVMANLQITPDRAENFRFSDPLYEEVQGILVRKEEGAAAAQTASAEEYTAMEQLTGKTIGVQTGTTFDHLVQGKIPGAVISYFNTKADLVAALTTMKIDAFAVDGPVAKLLLKETPGIACLEESLDTFRFAYIFPKTNEGQKRASQMSEFLLRMKQDGSLQALEDKWFGDEESRMTMPDLSSLKAENGTLKMATESGYAPFEYIRGTEVVGYDIDLAAQFCEAYGYGLEIMDMSYDAILPAVQGGKCDFGGAGISITPERAEAVLFSESNYEGSALMVVRKTEGAAAAGAGKQSNSFWDGIADSFNKTFIREDRWKLFTEGVGTTLLITVLSILFGTALGFVTFMLCRNGNPIANGITRVFTWLVQGMPMVVLLMVLYYIVFGSLSVSGVVVAVIGFTLTFGSAVYAMVKTGVGTIDPGQYEAAYALGHPNRQTFFRVILPQTLPHVMPAYQGEIIGLIKATAIVGYIAVMDLTKMGDIVRSRTYEAFFPLIAVTIIYFVLEGLFILLVGRISRRLDPKRRGRKSSLLKGVKIHD